MKFVHRASQHLQHLMDSDFASWIVVYVVTTLSLAISLVLLSNPPYFPK